MKNLKETVRIIESLDGQLSEACSHEKPLPCSFVETGKMLSSVNDVNTARHLLYYAFQPLFDLLLTEGHIKRTEAISLLGEVTDTSKKYLTEYYLGKPDLKIVHNLGNKIRNYELSEPVYKTKFRNIDYNGIYAKDIGRFIKRILLMVDKGKIEKPDAIIGCACGSSELALPLAGVFGCEIGFIRKSKRRSDDEPLLIAEQTDVIKEMCNGKNVICVEDYIVTARSLDAIMSKVKSMGAKTVIGAASIRSADEDLSLGLTWDTDTEGRNIIYKYGK